MDRRLKWKMKVVDGKTIAEIPHPELSLSPEESYRLGIEHGKMIQDLQARHPDIHFEVVPSTSVAKPA